MRELSVDELAFLEYISETYAEEECYYFHYRSKRR